jgi:hypothetical protein
VLDNEKLQVDFKPLYQSIHIYTALDSLDELRKSYQADRKVTWPLSSHLVIRLTVLVQAQSDLILPTPLPLSSLLQITQEIAGFFIIETQVLNSTCSFRSEREVNSLWDALVKRLSVAVEDSLRLESDPDGFLRVKEFLIGFIMTLEVGSLH